MNGPGERSAPNRRKLALHTRMLIGFGVGVVGGLVVHRYFAGDPALTSFLTGVTEPMRLPGRSVVTSVIVASTSVFFGKALVRGG